MSTSDVFKQFFAKLVNLLPMDDPLFVAELFSHDLLPGNHYDQVESKSTRANKAVYFLNHVIKPALTTDVGSLDRLLDVMEDTDYYVVKQLAKLIRTKLKEIQGPVSTDDTAILQVESTGEPTNKTTALQVASDKLRATYLTQTSPAQNDWPNYRVTKYVRLAIVEKLEKIYRADHEHHIGMLWSRGGVDKIQEKKKQLNFDGLSEIFCGNDRLILIMGGPGIGKTTLAHEICKKWAKVGLLSKAFCIVIVLLLRSIQQQSSEHVFEKLIGKDAFQELKNSLGKKCLIILEGLDEITFKCQQSDKFLTELMDSKLFQYSTIVVTSRPHACQEILKKANKIIEILGFGDKEMKEFVRNSFEQDTTQSCEVFLQQLEEHPQLYSLCHVPISLAMIIDIFKETKSFPSTLTELYYQFIVMMLVRDSGKTQEKSQVPLGVPMKQKIEDILHQALPGIQKEKLRNIFLLSKLAFNGFFAITGDDQIEKTIIKRDPKIVFIQDDLSQCGIVNIDDYDGHSLLKMETIHHFTGGQITFNFIHLTVQEFLCAVYMLTLSQEEQHHLLKEYFDGYPNIMTLYCGLTKLDFHQVVYSKLKSSRHPAVTAVHCLYEAQRNAAPHKSVAPFVLNLNHMRLLPYDTLCLSYVCCHYLVIQLNMKSCQIGDKGVGILAKWCLNKNDTTKLQELNLVGNGFTSEGMKHVMKIVTSSHTLRVLDVGFNNIGDVGISLCLQHINTLTKLRVAGCGLLVEGATYIKKMLMENKKLEYLDIGRNEIGDDGVRHVMEGLQQNDALTELRLWNCRISVKGATYIKEMLMENKKLQHLDIGGNEIGDDGVRHVTEGLQQNDALTELRLWVCRISVKGATYIKKMLMENKKLEYLDIGQNGIGADGVRHVMEGLQQNDTVTKLMLFECNISVKGATYIKKMLMEHKKLQHLNISKNCIDDDGVRYVTEGLQQNDTVTELLLWECNISVKGAISISEMIETNHTLQLLSISWNLIGDEGIAVIARTLNNTRISKLHVSNCNITVTGAKLLAENLKNNHTIKLLQMLSNDITVDGAIAILDAAVANGVCQEVIIDNEYESDDKVKELMSILEERKRQEESDNNNDNLVTMPVDDHHGKTTARDDQQQVDTK